jgi:molybdopterin converting factor small subunit
LPPVEAVPLIAPTPLLIVHGDQDPYFPVDHPLSLAAAAQGAAELWLEPGLGHAENAVGGPLLARIADWLTGSPGTSPGGGPDSPSWGGHAPRVPTGQRQEPPMAAAGTIRYWAAAKAAAGIAEEPYEAATLAEALDSARRRHADRPEFAQVLVRCSFLVNGDPVGTRGHDTVTLAEGGTVEVLPPFAGG